MAKNYAKEIAALERIVNSAVKDVSADGVRTSIDLDRAQKRLAELRRLAGDGQDQAKRKVSQLDLSGCW